MAYKTGRQFYELTNSIHQLMVNFSFMHNQCLKLGRVECDVLKFLIKHKKPATMKEIATAMGVTNSRITHLIDKLLEKNYVRRYELPDNRRLMFAEITPEGIDIAKKYSQKSIKAFNDFLKNVPLDDIEPIYHALGYWCEFLRKVNARLEPRKQLSPKQNQKGAKND